MNLSENKPKRKPAKGVFIEDGRKIELGGGEAEFARLLADVGEVRATDFPPGFRLSSVVHRLRWKRGLKVLTQPEPNASGQGTHAVYRPVGELGVVEFAPRERR